MYLFPNSFLLVITVYSFLIVISLSILPLFIYNHSFYAYPGIFVKSNLQIVLDLSVKNDLVAILLSEFFFCFAIGYALRFRRKFFKDYFETSPYNFISDLTKRSIFLFLAFLFFILLLQEQYSWNYGIKDFFSFYSLFGTFACLSVMGASTTLKRRASLCEWIFWGSLLFQFFVRLSSFFLTNSLSMHDYGAVGLLSYYFFLDVTRSGVLVFLLLLSFRIYNRKYFGLQNKTPSLQ